MKLLVDVPVEPAALTALQASGRFAVDVITPPAETALAHLCVRHVHRLPLMPLM